jgi:dynactin complex subunit
MEGEGFVSMTAFPLPQKLGTRSELTGEVSLRFLSRTGLTDFKPGYWVGVRYDEPLGKNDGR